MDVYLGSPLFEVQIRYWVARKKLACSGTVLLMSVPHSKSFLFGGHRVADKGKFWFL
jgi:hypothetical protein